VATLHLTYKNCVKIKNAQNTIETGVLDVDVQTQNVVAGRNVTVVVKSEAVYRLIVTKPTDDAAGPLSSWTENVSTGDGCFEGQIFNFSANFRRRVSHYMFEDESKEAPP
jgi:hypothetical protein